MSPCLLLEYLREADMKGNDNKSGPSEIKRGSSSWFTLLLLPSASLFLPATQRLWSQKDVDKPLTCPPFSFPSSPLFLSISSSLSFPEPWCSILIGPDGYAMVHAFPLQNTKQWRVESCVHEKKKMTCATGRHGWIDQSQYSGGGGLERRGGARKLRKWTRPLKKSDVNKESTDF